MKVVWCPRIEHVRANNDLLFYNSRPFYNSSLYTLRFELFLYVQLVQVIDRRKITDEDDIICLFGLLINIHWLSIPFIKLCFFSQKVITFTFIVHGQL